MLIPWAWLRPLLPLEWGAATPMARLLRKTAKGHRRLLLLHLGFTVMLGLSEACLFTLIFRTVQLIASPAAAAMPLGLNRGSLYLVLLLSILALQGLASFCRAMTGILSGRFAAACQAQVIPSIHNYILSLSYGCASGFKIGDLNHRCSLASIAINAQIEQASTIISNALLSAVYLYVLVRISPWLMLLAACLALGMALTHTWLRPRIREAARQVEQQQRQVAASSMADLQVLNLLHSHAAIDTANHRFERTLQGLQTKQQRLSDLRSLLEPIAELLPILAAVALGLLSWKLTGGRAELLVPSLATFVLALQRLNIRLVKVSTSLNLLNENQARIQLLDSLLRPDNKTFRRQGGLPFTGLQHEIQFCAVGHTYPGQHTPALQAVSFQLRRNSTVALVGASGAGKSTLADLLIGLQSPSSGAILIDGTDLQTIDLNSWQQRLGVVSQDVQLINDTIAANIAFGLAEGSLDEEAIHRAAAAACADGFINELPAGFATVVGEKGYRLSGGQRQRISLARAILREPEILILDEATSALDSHSEAEVHQAINAFSTGRTVLAIAHRLSSIRDAEEILVLDAGRIVERGHHSELIATGGRYASLWARQVQRADQPSTRHT